MTTALLRSVLYIPGSKPRALDKARGLPADAIIFDLEDAVAPDEKPAARETLREELEKGGYGDRLKLVRVNGADTPWGADDLSTATEMDCDAILLPKVSETGDLDAAARVTDKPLWAMMETPRGVLNALAIADHPRLHGFVLGTNDLAKEMGCASGDRVALSTAIRTSLMAARAGGIFCVDGVFNAFKDEDGLRTECEEGRRLGMDGKTLIHPAQLDVANEVFAPSEVEVDLARRQIAAYDESLARGEAVAVVDGRIVEALHIETARKVLARHDAIRERQG